MLKDQLSVLGVGRDALFRILRANHLLIKPSRQYHTTTMSHHRFRKHKNLIEDLNVDAPEQVWVSDITYLGDRDRPAYLALVTDAYSKVIMGYDVSDTLATAGSLRALKMAIKARQWPLQPLIHHSDRGIQYCGDEYQKSLKSSRVVCSMTESYDPYANAVAERVNGILKQEFLTHRQGLNLPLMKQLVKESINLYNTLRPHLSCEMHTPAYMHTQNQVQIKTYKKKAVVENSLTLLNC